VRARRIAGWLSAPRHIAGSDSFLTLALTSDPFAVLVSFSMTIGQQGEIEHDSAH
jgi:hypothetical protein